MIKLDSSAAWATAARLVGANREVLAAIAGVFFLLPSLVAATLVPEPQVPQGLSPNDMMALLVDAYWQAMPYLIVVSVLQMIGTLTVLVVMTARDRPTVGQSIRRGFVMTGPYFLAQMLVALVLGIVFTVLVSLGALTGVKAIAALGVLLTLGLMIYCGVRVSLVAPVIAIENLRNPIAAIRRSWTLTHGNAGRLALFLLLAIVVFTVVYGLVMMVVGVVLVLTTGGEVQRMLGAAVASTLTAGALVYLAAMLAAVHDQLAGPTSHKVLATFE